MSGAKHKVGPIKVQWMFENKIQIELQDGRKLWTNSFKIVREEIKKSNNQIEFKF